MVPARYRAAARGARPRPQQPARHSLSGRRHGAAGSNPAAMQAAAGPTPAQRARVQLDGRPRLVLRQAHARQVERGLRQAQPALRRRRCLLHLRAHDPNRKQRRLHLLHLRHLPQTLSRIGTTFCTCARRAGRRSGGARGCANTASPGRRRQAAGQHACPAKGARQPRSCTMPAPPRAGPAGYILAPRQPARAPANPKPTPYRLTTASGLGYRGNHNLQGDTSPAGLQLACTAGLHVSRPPHPRSFKNGTGAQDGVA